MPTSYIDFIRNYWTVRNCRNVAYRKGNRAMLRHFIGKERARRAAFNQTTAGV